MVYKFRCISNRARIGVHASNFFLFTNSTIASFFSLIFKHTFATKEIFVLTISTHSDTKAPINNKRVNNNTFDD